MKLSDDFRNILSNLSELETDNLIAAVKEHCYKNGFISVFHNHIDLEDFPEYVRLKDAIDDIKDITKKL